ncbi:uncharacterized protein BYT42DRAFT_553510 [Radiomyces spectabilis]|uniref:uncharacterized protein n=1 Tax=Radiomyces spectabilis TaxID=64574 RepID=UPI00221F0640|nr:uncharacterized protein BYT42DRAFT_553510 [Radiomyces spectabilis]KAI8394136.1 hypothetical protein BYT42DRAFT_553510 [Radiomyces spectabilis]
MRSNRKLILGLINRIAARLPVNNSGRKIETLEQDPIIQQTVAAVIELSSHKLTTVANALGTVLENVSKTNSVDQFIPFEALQSQLFVLRLFSACLQHHWNSHQKQSAPSNPSQSNTAQNTSLDVNTVDPPPLDEALVAYIFMLMSQYLSMFHRMDADDMEDTEVQKPKTDLATYELTVDIYRAAGKVLYYVSASNWPTYYAKVKNAVHALGAVSETADLSYEIRMLECCCLNRSRLHIVLSELSPYFLHMKDSGKLLFSRMMKRAIWNWIQTYPSEFAEVSATTDRLLSGSEVLFDMCNAAADTPRKKAVLWPLQAILLALSPDLLVQALLENPSAQNNRRTSFLTVLRKSLRSSKGEIAAMSYVELCKASMYVPPTEESVLRHIAADIESDLQEKIWDFSGGSFVDASLEVPSLRSLASDYLLTRLRLDPEKTLSTIVPTCTDENAPVAFRTALVNACASIVHDDVLPWNPSISSMYNSLCSILREIFMHTIGIEITKRPEMPNASKRSLDKRPEIRTRETFELLENLLRLFKMDPLLALLGSDEDRVEQNAAFMTGMIALLQHNDPLIRQAASECLAKLHDPASIVHWGPKTGNMRNFWRVSSQVIFALAKNVLDIKQNDDSLKGLFSLLLKLLKTRNAFLRDNQEHARDGIDVRERLQGSVALEIALLVSLCSSTPEICSIATKCFDLLCVEAQLMEEDENSHQNQITFVSNLPIYVGLASKDNVFLGRKAQQKSVRKSLRMMSRATPGNLAAWEEVWKRWKVLTPMVVRSGEELWEEDPVTGKRVPRLDQKTKAPMGKPTIMGRTDIHEEKQTEWQNYTGFLAALGGCCLASQEDKEDGISGREMANMIDRYMTEMVDLLTADNVVVRESVKDTLGCDLSPGLYAILFRHLEAAMNRSFDADKEVICSPRTTLLVEQGVFILKSILDRLTDPGDCLLSIDFSTLINPFAAYLSKLPSSYAALRIKIKMCHLVEALVLKKEQIILRDEMRMRNKLLEIIVEWTSDFALQKPDVKYSSVYQDMSQSDKLHNDLDLACLKTIVAILHQLPLQLPEPTREADTTQFKNRLFYKYFTFFLKLLNRCRSSEALHQMELSNSSSTRRSKETVMSPSSKTITPDSNQDMTALKDYTILAISNLLRANVDAGLKYSLAMGYHEDMRTRTAFMQVLTNILNQGAEFETLAENVMTDRYESLTDLLVESDLEIALSLCEVCPSIDYTGVAEVLLTCFESRNKVSPFLEAVIKKEVASTEQEATLFRSTNMATRLLSLFAKQCCIDYIRITLQPAIERINNLPEAQQTWELDPRIMNPDEDIATNRQNVIRATEILLDAICASPPTAPRLFREELSLIADAVRQRFPEAKYTAVGGFVFLRLFGPAILTPESSGFSKQAIPKTKNIRKLLLQATRVMQNLANNVLFGAKETHMIVLNDFLTSKIYQVTRFLREISEVPPLSDSKDEFAAVRMDQKAYVRLHRYLSDNLDRMSRDLSSRKIKTGDHTQVMLVWKRTLDKLSNLLAQLGRPPEIAQPEFTPSRNYAVANSNHIYSEFINRNSHRDLSRINSLNIFYQAGVSRGGRPVFYLISRNVPEEDFDFELLVYYMLRVMEPYLNNPFELLFDITRFSGKSEIPIHWLNQFFRLVFSEMNDYLVALHIFNPNTHLQQYIRKLPLILTNKLVKRTRFSLTLADLQKLIAPAEIHLPKETMDLEKELSTIFTPVTRVASMNINIPVTVKIGPEHMQIVTNRKQEIFWSLNTVLNDVFHISELSDVTILPTTKNDVGGELCIKYDGGKSMLVLTSPKREAMLSLLRYNKQRYESSRPSGSHEHAIRPNDVPGRLLNMALLNIGSDDPDLRLAAYNLLYALSISFRFDIGNQLLIARDLCIPANSTGFIVSISESIAATEPHLTLEFLNEWFVGFNKSTENMRLLCLDYMAPWLRNLATFARNVNDDPNRSLAKTKEVLRLLIDLTVSQPDIYKHMQTRVWKTLARVDDIINLVLDAFVQCSVECGVGSPQAEAMADTFVTMSSVAVRGKVINRMRRVIQRTSSKPCRTLTDHAAWPEIAVLLRFMLMMSFSNTGPVKPYLPEIFHTVSLIVATGPTLIRSSVHELVVNVIHMLCTAVPLPEENVKKLHFLLNDVCDGKSRVYFGLIKPHANALTVTKDTITDYADTVNLTSLENIVRLLLEATNVGAPSTDIGNMWRARWMGLVTSTAFQFNPAIQPRSFVVLGCLAQEEVDDDLVYQILVALRGALAVFNETNPSLIVSIMMCLSNIIDHLPADSRYLSSLFWLAVSLVQMGHPATFATAVQFLQSVLRALDARKLFFHHAMEPTLKRAREPLADIARDLDREVGVSFDNQFSFAIAAILLKGLKHCPREIVFDCLGAFLETNCKQMLDNVVESDSLGYLAVLLPFAAKNNALKEVLRLAGLDDIDLQSIESNQYVRMFGIFDIPDNTTALLLVSLLVTMLNFTENEAEKLFLYSFLSEAAVSIPEVFTLVYESLLPKMNQIFVTSQNHALIEAVKGILLTACSEPAFYSGHVARRTQQSFLDELGFSALSEPNFGAGKSNVALNAELASKLLDRITD